MWTGLQPLNNKPLQAYLSDKVQLFHIVKEVLHQVGQAHLMITTFSISEEFIRSLARMKQEQKVLSAQLVIDARAATKLERILPFARNVFDKIYLASNHSKVILFDAPNAKVSICTSQNQTRGNRHECGMITTDEDVYASYTEAIKLLKDAGREI